MKHKKRKINKQDIGDMKSMSHCGLKSPRPGLLLDEEKGKCGIVRCCALYKDKSDKPLLAILISAHAESEAIEARKKLVARGIPCFPSFERGANVLNKVVAYYKSASLQ